MAAWEVNRFGVAARDGSVDEVGDVMLCVGTENKFGMEENEIARRELGEDDSSQSDRSVSSAYVSVNIASLENFNPRTTAYATIVKILPEVVVF